MNTPMLKRKRKRKITKYDPVEDLRKELEETKMDLLNEVNSINKQLDVIEKIGETHAMIRDIYDGTNPRVVTVGDYVTCKYGEYGPIINMDFSEYKGEYYQVHITIKDVGTDTEITHTADRFQ